MRVTIRPLVFAAVLLLPLAAAAAGVYKWKDADGNMHYSDTPPPEDVSAKAQGGVTEMQLNADTADTHVAHKMPIPNPKPNGGPSIGLDSFTLKLDAANSRNVTIGREFTGKNCSQGTDVQWNDGILDLKGRTASLAVAERFRDSGYRFVIDGESGGAGLSDLSLDAELLAMKFDVCSTIQSGNTYGPGSRGYVRVRWTLRRDPGSEPLYRGISAGSYDAWRPGGGTKETLLKAIAAAADNLLGERAFADAVSGESAAPTAALPPATPVNVAVAYGNGVGTFRARSEALLRSAITVKTSRGHGSGVLIDAAGYALTNSHVVGSDSAVKVLLDDEFVDARVVRNDRHADVALLQFDPRGHQAASVARNEPHAGDQLFVIGTPLSLKLSNTVTQGILSAVREVDGARLFQTDAAVHPGNSGGPVFDAAGDLVALSVSGLVSADGATMNVNYLIPIGRALTAVGAGFN